MALSSLRSKSFAKNKNQNKLRFTQMNESWRLSKAQMISTRETELLEKVDQLESVNKDLRAKLATEKEKYDSLKDILELVLQTLPTDGTHLALIL